jgi:regulator of sirC expression with transglutaminase-like and TPR domain
LFPDDYATQYNLAKALQASGDTNAAIAAYERAIQLAPGQPDFQLSYGLALEAAKRPGDAAEAYRRYLELEPQAPDAEKVKAHLAELQPATAAPAAAGS